MKTFNTRGILLGAALLGTGTVFTFVSSASAAPRNNRDVQEARKDVKQAKKEVREERKDLRQADTLRERQEAQRELRNAQNDLQREKRDLRNERKDNRKPVFQSRLYQGRSAPVRPNNNWNGGRRYTGTVTKVRSDNSFDINIGGKTFNVYATSRVPRSLSSGDHVQVTGVQQYNNDIRNASVSILHNR